MKVIHATIWIKRAIRIVQGVTKHSLIKNSVIKLSELSNLSQTDI